jgi:hypothetical protein
MVGYGRHGVMHPLAGISGQKGGEVRTSPVRTVNPSAMLTSTTAWWRKDMARVSRSFDRIRAKIKVEFVAETLSQLAATVESQRARAEVEGAEQCQPAQTLEYGCAQVLDGRQPVGGAEILGMLHRTIWPASEPSQWHVATSRKQATEQALPTDQIEACWLC